MNNIKYQNRVKSEYSAANCWWDVSNTNGGLTRLLPCHLNVVNVHLMIMIVHVIIDQQLNDGNDVVVYLIGYNQLMVYV
jgi:hypothetical protein